MFTSRVATRVNAIECASESCDFTSNMFTNHPWARHAWRTAPSIELPSAIAASCGYTVAL